MPADGNDAVQRDADVDGGKQSTTSEKERTTANTATAPPTTDEGGRSPTTTQSATTMDLNVAYESLEVMRNLNLQVEFGERVDVNQCVSCLRELRSGGNDGTLLSSQSSSASQTIRRWRSSSSMGKAASPCLACGSPMCSRHSCSGFYKQNITICQKCSHLFAPDLVATTVIAATSDIKHEGDDQIMETPMDVNYILEVYDRALLILKFSAQYIDDIADALERNTRRNDKIGLGSSATGVMAGMVGVAAAATIWTPIGPPLLIASILFGSGATAAAAGSEAVNYRCEPHQMANRIITLHSIITAITHLPAAMDDMAADTTNKTGKKDARESNRSSLHWARATMNGLKPLTMGTLSAVSVVTEAREVKKTVDKLRAGSPCEMAQELRRIQVELETLVDTGTFASHLTFVISRRLKRSITNDEC